MSAVPRETFVPAGPGAAGTRRARREGASCRRRFCLAILLLLLAHQALAMRDHRDAGDAVFATATAPTVAAPDAVAGPTAFPDMVAGLLASDAPAMLRGACPAHQGTVPAPGGTDPCPVASHPAAARPAPPQAGPPRARGGDPRRRRALLQVFRN